MRIVIRNSDKAPIYEQIKEQIKEAILIGELEEGESLPSIRQLARDLKISVITTTRAYSDLEQEGFITNVQGKGCFVLPQNTDFVREQALVEIEDAFLSAIKAAKKAKLSKKELLEIFELMSKEDFT